MGWYRSEQRDLPWRKTQDPYKVWLSEIILQQTRVVQGLPYYQRFTEAFPKVEDLAKASEEEVLKLWQGLGYYSRARNLHATAQKVAFELGGKFPENFKELLTLKGVGEYTASAIASICYNEAVAVVDGNVYRVLARYLGIDTPINSKEGISQFKELANQLLDKEQAGTYNQAIMDFGAIQCKPQSPDCTICPVQVSCQAYQLGKVDVLPVKIKKTKIKNLFLNYFVLLDNEGNTLLNKRDKKGIWQGLYEFPVWETAQNKNEKEITTYIKENFSEVIDIEIFNNEPIIHKLSHRHLSVTFWIVRVSSLPLGRICAQRVYEYPVSALTANFLEKFDF